MRIKESIAMINENTETVNQSKNKSCLFDSLKTPDLENTENGRNYLSILNKQKKPKSFLEDLKNQTNVLNNLNNKSDSSILSIRKQTNLNLNFNSNNLNVVGDQVAIVEVILRFLQLLCENHNLNLQNYLRSQENNKKITILFVKHYNFWTVFVDRPLEALVFWVYG